jgi:MraZ protein
VKSGMTEMTQPLPATSEQLGVGAPVSFCGTYRHHVDPKGRVAVPAQLRRGLPDGSVVAPGPDQRLMIWPPQEWDNQQELYRRTAETPAQERRFLRTLLGSSYPFEVDAQGRLLLTAWQRGWAQIGDTAVFVGLGRGVEIAGQETWLAQQGELDPEEFTRLNDLVNQRGSAGTPVSH